MKVALDDSEVVLAALLERFASPSYRPPVLPAVAVEVHGLTRRADASMAEVVGVLARDPLLTTDVLRRAGSAVYGARSAPRTLQEAAIRLGMRGLGEIVFEVALARVFRVRGLEQVMEQLHTHSVATGHHARVLGPSAGASGGVALLAGLLKDVGHVAPFGSVPVDAALSALGLRASDVDRLAA